jgi:hypothetical protein
MAFSSSGKAITSSAYSDILISTGFSTGIGKESIPSSFYAH